MSTVATVSDLRDRASDVLCSRSLANIVELVYWSPEPDVYEARAVDGYIRFRRIADGPNFTFTTDSSGGRNPLGVQDTARFAPLSAELASPNPTRRHNSYPYAYEHIAQIFDHPCAPDLGVLHTSSHRCEDHRGEHGSLGVVQARAPFVISGAGVTHDGMVDRHCRLVDVAPTILALLGNEPHRAMGPSGSTRDDAFLSRQDGDVIDDLIDSGAEPTTRIIAFLLDGTNPNMLYDMAASGNAPTIGRLIENGTAFRFGAFASLPTVTLPNHTTLLTGCHPGHHGVLHNAWYDRGRGRQVVTESASTWHEAMDWLVPGVQTIHDSLAESRPGACTISVNEPADRGATYSTFDLLRTGRGRELAGMESATPDRTTKELAESSEAYRWGSAIDASSVAQACTLLEGRFGGTAFQTPAFMWVNTALTDAASHEGGPHSEIALSAVRETDARIGDILGTVDQTLGSEGTTVIVVADHGMELNDPDTTGDWGDSLRQAGITFRDEASGFLYFGVD